MGKEINQYLHCGKCIEEIPDGLSAQEWQQLEIGYTAKGLQIWCRRHDCNVCNIDFEGQTHPADIEAPKNMPDTLEEMDLDAFFNLREWVEIALTNQGAKITDGGMGFGCADIGMTVEGMPYSLQIRPRPLKQADYGDLAG